MYLIEDKFDQLLKNSSQNDTLYKNNNKVPIIQSMVYEHVMYTNEQYKKKMNKSQKKDTQEITLSKSDFDVFLDKSIDDSKFSHWKQVPLSIKSKMVIQYITNDLNINDSDKSRYIDLFKDHNLYLKKQLIKYSCKNGVISKINYDLLC